MMSFKDREAFRSAVLKLGSDIPIQVEFAKRTIAEIADRNIQWHHEAVEKALREEEDLSAVPALVDKLDGLTQSLLSEWGRILKTLGVTGTLLAELRQPTPRVLPGAGTHERGISCRNTHPRR